MSQKKENRGKNNGLRGWLAAAALFLSFMLPREMLAQPITADTAVTASTALMATCP